MRICGDSCSFCSRDPCWSDLLALYSLLLDESRSTLNALLKSRIEAKAWDVSRIGLVEVNNVCDGGIALLQTLRAIP